MSLFSGWTLISARLYNRLPRGRIPQRSRNRISIPQWVPAPSSPCWKYVWWALLGLQIWRSTRFAYFVPHYVCKFFSARYANIPLHWVCISGVIEKFIGIANARMHHLAVLHWENNPSSRIITHCTMQFTITTSQIFDSWITSIVLAYDITDFCICATATTLYKRGTSENIEPVLVLSSNHNYSYDQLLHSQLASIQRDWSRSRSSGLSLMALPPQWITFNRTRGFNKVCAVKKLYVLVPNQN